MKYSIASTLMVGLCLTVLAFPVLALSAVEDLVQRKAEILRIVHKKARKALANAAQDHAFQGYFTSTDAVSRDAFKDRIDRIALGVQSRFDAEEMCLIDPAGREISRVVGSRIDHDLTDGEAHANFFAPGFAHKPRSVHVSPAYLSDDAHKWVVAYATPVMVGDDKRAILHYEHGLDRYQRTLNRDLDGDDVFLLTIDAEGYVIADSRRRIGVARHHEQHAPADYFQRFEFGGDALAATRRRIDERHLLRSVEGRAYHAAYATVEDWTLIAFRSAARDARDEQQRVLP